MISGNVIAFRIRSAVTPPFRAISTPQCMWSSSPTECASGLMLNLTGGACVFDARWRRAAHVVRRHEPGSDWEGTQTASNGCLCMRTRVRQELRTALLIAIGLAVLCFGAAAIAAKLIGQS